MRERYSPNSPLAARFGIASGKLDDIHVRIKLLRNAIEQRKGPAYHQQICGKTADALHKLHWPAEPFRPFSERGIGKESSAETQAITRERERDWAAGTKRVACSCTESPAFIQRNALDRARSLRRARNRAGSGVQHERSANRVLETAASLGGSVDQRLSVRLHAA